MRTEGASKRKKMPWKWMYGITALLLILLAFFMVMAFRTYLEGSSELLGEQEYHRYYAMVVEDSSSAFWQSVYQGARERGQEMNVFVELLGQDLSQEYTRTELMEIAIAADVDGILVEADESQEMTGLIDQAWEEGIPVVTLYSDCTQSRRLSFVGVGSYNLGREYGRQVLEIVNPFEQTDVTILMNANARDTGQNILSSGIQETIEKEKNQNADIQISYVTVEDTNMFSVEESVRDIFMEEALPDILICLNELNTACAYQAVVDYNKVGAVKIVGYYDSDVILKAIDRNVIYSTITVDTFQLGSYGVDALAEYEQSGTVSGYFTADSSIINKSNVFYYLEEP